MRSERKARTHGNTHLPRYRQPRQDVARALAPRESKTAGFEPGGRPPVVALDASRPVLESPSVPNPSGDVSELLRMASSTRADGGALNQQARQAFIDRLPTLRDAGGLEQTLLARAAELVGSPEGLRLDSPQSPGFSGAAIFIVKQNNQPVMVAKVTPFDALLNEVSTQPMLRAAGIDGMPQVLAMAKLANPTPTGNVAVELMSFTSGLNTAREGWWIHQKENDPSLPAALFERVGEATAALHGARRADRMDPSKVDGMTFGRLEPAEYQRFMEGAQVDAAVPNVPSAVPTAQNLGVSGIEWLRRVSSSEGVLKLGVFDFSQLEAQHRELAQRFRENPGEAAVVHGDFHQGQLAIGEKVNMFDLELLGKNLNADGTPLMSPAYDLASMLVNMRYFARYAGFNSKEIQNIEDSFLRGYEKAGGKRPTDDQLDFFKLWRQTWVMSLFQNTPPIEALRHQEATLNRAVSQGDQKARLELAQVQRQISALTKHPPAVDPMRVREQMARTLADVSNSIAKRLPPSP